mgnify:CR=1 FL=1
MEVYYVNEDQKITTFRGRPAAYIQSQLKNWIMDYLVGRRRGTWTQEHKILSQAP